MVPTAFDDRFQLFKESMEARLHGMESAIKSVETKIESYPSNVILDLVVSPIKIDVERITEKVDSYITDRSRHEQQLKIALIAAVVSPFVSLITMMVFTVITNGGIK